MKNPKGKFRIAAAGAILLTLCSGCISSPAKKSLPLVEVRLNGDAYPGPNTHVPVGLLFVACANGRVVRAQSDLLAGQNLVEGKLSAQRFSRLKERLAKSNVRDLKAECQMHEIDGGTASVAVWNKSDRQFLRCTWPPFGQQGKLLHTAIWEVEIDNRTPHVDNLTAEQMCR